MPYICTACAKDEHLKALIKSKGKKYKCSLCKEDEIALSSQNNQLFQLYKALIRFHFNEWEYNGHFGGNGFENLFYGEDNIFFNESRIKKSEIYDDIVTNISERKMYEEYDKGITLYSGNTDGERNPPLLSIKNTLDQRLLNIAKRLKTENHFDLENELKEILIPFKDIAATTIKSDQIFYRARTGYIEKKRSLDFDAEPAYHYAPYTGKDIGPPGPSIAGAGRANRFGVSFLYCATNEQTAIAEIRPHPGDRVSVGSFRLNREIKAYDLSKSHLLHFYRNDKLLDSFTALNTLRVLINKTITPAERSHYSVTQLISDCIRQLGFEAIMFKSTVGSGKNIVVFNSRNTEYIENSSKIYLINKVDYHFSSEKMID